MLPSKQPTIIGPLKGWTPKTCASKKLSFDLPTPANRVVSLFVYVEHKHGKPTCNSAKTPVVMFVTCADFESVGANLLP